MDMKNLIKIDLLFILMLAVLCLGVDTARAQKPNASAELKRLTDLQAKLAKIPMDQHENEPYKSLLKKNEKLVVFSEPAGMWYVRSELFWDLQKRYNSLAIADDIAWVAAENPLPGECEGYINCNLYLLKETYVRYLKLYPKGKYSKKALKELTDDLGLISRGISNYTGPTDTVDRAELGKTTTEIKNVLSSLGDPESIRTASLIDKIIAAFK
jgi:hypothetical protein